MSITKEITCQDKKSAICNLILRELPTWFGIESSIIEYVEAVRNMPFYATYVENTPIGFVAIKPHNIYTAEIYVMGILSEYHRQGIGKTLVEQCDIFCKKNNMEYLTVKTLDESAKSNSYEKTRKFYLAAGFRPLEVFPLHWDKSNPCLFLAKKIDIIK